MRIQLQTPTGLVKQVKLGFSWTTLFFNFFPALFRGDLKWAGIMFIFTLVAAAFTSGFASWLPSIIFAFIYNKLYIRDLIEKGYQPADEFSQNALIDAGILTNRVF